MKQPARITTILMLLIGLFVAAMGAAHAESSRLHKILAADELRVCIWPGYYSISYRDPRSQVVTGIDADLARELAKELDVTLTFVDSSFPRLVSDVLQERCDVAMFAIGIMPERQKHLSFTRPHLVSDVLAITTRSNRTIRSWDDLDQSGRVLAVATGSSIEAVMRQRLQHAGIMSVDTTHARDLEVLSGRADALITDYPYARRMLQTTDWARLVEPADTFHLTYYAWAFKPGDEQWQERLDDFVHTIKKDGRLRATARKHKLEPAVLLE